MRNLVVLSALGLAGCSSLPPSHLELSIHCHGDQIEVKARAEDKFVGDTKNAPASVAACVQRRYRDLESLGFSSYVAAFRERKPLAQVASRISGCAFDDFDDDAHDRALIPFTLHEATHLLGSIFDGVCPKGLSRCQTSQSRYEVFTGTPGKLRLTIPYVPGMPKVNTITKELGADTMLDTLRTYLGLPSRKADASKPVDSVTEALGHGDFYLVWDEWNAYLTMLEIYTAQAAQADCWVYLTFDTYEVALSWPDLVHRYLWVLEQKYPQLYHLLTADGRFAKALHEQLDRSERAIGRAAKYPCVRRALPEVVAAEAQYTAVYGKLRSRTRKP